MISVAQAFSTETKKRLTSSVQRTQNMKPGLTELNHVS